MDTSIFSYAAAKKLQEPFSEEQIDNLLDVLYNRELSDAEKETVVKTLLPNHQEYAQHYAHTRNSVLVTSDFAQTYSNYRALGLPQKDAARMCGITLGRLNSILGGVGVSGKQHQMMLLAEQSAMSKFRHTNLKVVHDAAQEGKWQAAVALLEKVLPDEYGKRVDVHNSGSMRLTNEECEVMSGKAADDLQRLREQRKAEQNNVQAE